MAKQAAPTLGELIDKMFEVREQIRALNAEADKLGETKNQLEAQLIVALEGQKLESSRGGKAIATLSKAIVPQVADWDKAYAFIIKNKAPYLLEKRMSASIFREMLDARNGKAIPGVESFTRKTISLRTT